MKTETELFERLPQGRYTRTPNRERQKAAIALASDIHEQWMLGISSRQIAANLDCTTQHVNRVLKKDRKLMAEGHYDKELATMRAAGVTTLPTRESGGKGKAGRPVASFTPAEQAMREEFATGKIGIADLARKHGSYPQKARYILSKSPSVLK